jgi:hypothetical protein
MKVSNLFAVSALALGLAACGSDGIDLNVATTDNSVDNSTGNGGGGGDGNNPCASYTTATATVVRGTFDGTNCRYAASFVGANNPLTVDLTIPLISGVHIFQDSLFVGQNVSSGAAPAEGAGPTLTIEAGSTLAFSDSSDYVLINRGSQIIAEGSAAAPITFTGYTDAVTGTAGPEDVQLWGGIVINGNAITNNCSDAERAANQCHVVSEGQPSNYGGSNNAENSGILRYVVVKHTGYEVAPGDELNGITFNAVGSGTTVENVEVYSTYDDGVEFFGGAVNITNLVAMYVRDDSIDFSDGYVGTVANALVIHPAENGNRCIEGDNIGETRAASQPMDLAPISNPTITRMTCITSNKDQANGGTHGDSEGVLFRFGARGSVTDSIVFAGYPTPSRPANPSNECIEIESPVSLAAAAAGDARMTGTILACSEPTKGALANADSLGEWFAGANPSTGGANYSFNVENRVFNAPAAADSPSLRILEANSFYTAPAFADVAGAAFTIGAAPQRPIGAVLRGDDWTANWTYGLHASNRGQALWFE